MQIVTIKELSLLIKLSPWKIRDLVTQGMPVINKSDKQLFDVEDVVAWLKDKN